MHQGFSTRGKILFYEPSYCVRWRVSGVLNYRAVYEKYWGEAVPQWLYRYYVDRVSITGTALEVNTFKRDGSTCTSKRKNWSKLNLGMHARGYTCRFNPSISVSAPWGVSVSAWPSCGEEELKTLRSSNIPAANHHVMRRSDNADRIAFNGRQKRGPYEQKKTGLNWSCYGLNFDLNILQSGVGDDTKYSSRTKACPGWDGSLAIF